MKIEKINWNLLKIIYSREDKRPSGFFCGVFIWSMPLFSACKCRWGDWQHLSSIFIWVCQFLKNVLIIELDIHFSNEEGMAQSIFGWNPHLWVFFKHFCEQIKCFWVKLAINFLLEIKITLPILSQNFIVFLSLEYRMPKQKIMKDDPCREYITNGFAFSIHIFDVNDLRSHKARSAASNEQILLFFSVCGQPEIANCQFLRIFFFEENVFRLQVSMYYLMLGKMT